jgi:hypothetical protein
MHISIIELGIKKPNENAFASKSSDNKINKRFSIIHKYETLIAA